jgi:hypothetical protein
MTIPLRGRTDRIDPVNPIYSTGLCDWGDMKPQSRNRTNVHLLTKRDGTTMPAWAELTGQNANGWTDTWMIHGKPKGTLTTVGIGQHHLVHFAGANQVLDLVRTGMRDE